MELANLISKSDFSVVDSLYVVFLSMVFIFAVLMFLMAVLTLSPIVIKAIENLLNPNKDTQQQPSTTQEPPTDQEDEQIVAAITATLTQTRKEQNISAPFVIKKIKRK